MADGCCLMAGGEWYESVIDLVLRVYYIPFPSLYCCTCPRVVRESALIGVCFVDFEETPGGLSSRPPLQPELHVPAFNARLSHQHTYHGPSTSPLSCSGAGLDVVVLSTLGRTPFSTLTRCRQHPMYIKKSQVRYTETTKESSVYD